jgi:DNA polymerase-2
MSQAQTAAIVDLSSDGAADLPVFRAFLVHAYVDFSRTPQRAGDRIFLTGRLEDGRSFGAAENRWRPCFHVYESDRSRWADILSSIKYEVCPPRLEPFSGNEKLVLLEFSRYGDRSAAVKLL